MLPYNSLTGDYPDTGRDRFPYNVGSREGSGGRRGPCRPSTVSKYKFYPLSVVVSQTLNASLPFKHFRLWRALYITADCSAKSDVAGNTQLRPKIAQQCSVMLNEAKTWMPRPRLSPELRGRGRGQFLEVEAKVRPKIIMKKVPNND